MEQHPPAHWTETTHIDLTDIAARRMGLSRFHRELLCRNIMVPDSWGVLDKIRHYMPLCSLFAGELTREAICASRVRQKTGFEKLGHAMHFLQDAGNPWHGRPLLPSYQKNHTIYEEYVAGNMREGFCFSRSLAGIREQGRFHLLFAHRIHDGAAFLARQAAGKFSFLDTAIRTDPSWKESEEVAAITLDLLNSCMEMCETQIHSFAIRAEPRAIRPIRLPAAVTWTFLGSDERRLAAVSPVS